MSQAAVQPGVAALAIFHKHTATLPVTFSGMSGPLTLRLVPPDGYVSGLILDTATVTADGAANTRDLVISAPGLPEFYTPDQSLSATYTLVVSQDGHDLARAPVTIEERLLDIQTSVVPGSVSGTSGDQVSFTVVVRVTPALEGPLPVTLDGCPVEGCGFAATPVGPTTGNGSTMSQQFTMNLPQDALPPAGVMTNLHYAVGVGDFAGYRRGWYGTTAVTLGLTGAP
ncbi:hypothetical protein E7T09_19865 [Deinococcus sp. KSM4-11]|uniref:hypothetical protein n=1 Tax=Deinococcus sp. KSM4-11 TaxID=2568654 RepID=UPI0010A3BCA3|nr:hypothetical protein [Deinococcus sp. KSM4-11]THF84892.1 hypothetical protein E7T09_19865 [Deinococcus sp. KSM4-11]